MGKFRTVYRYLRNEDIRCDLGGKHLATIHRVMHLEEVGRANKWIKSLNYSSDGYGEVRIAVDNQGRVWRSEPNWDGYQAWTCDDDIDDKEYYFDSLVMTGDIAFDEEGTRIRSFSENYKRKMAYASNTRSK